MTELLVQQMPVLKALPADELARLSGLSQTRAFPRGAFLFREGERGDVFHIILKGKAEVVKALGTRDERIIGLHGRGDFAGELGLLSDDQTRTTTVRAAEELETLEVPLAEFNAALRKYPQVGIDVSRWLNQRHEAAHNDSLRGLLASNRRLRLTRWLAIIVLGLPLLGVSAMAGTLAFFLMSAQTALDTPSPLVLFIADTGRNFIIPGDAAARTNPVASGPDTLAAGRRAYTARCVTCHGSDGKGQTTIGLHTYPRASDLSSAKTQARTDGALAWIIAFGSPHTGMPGWKGTLKDDEIWQVVGYMRQLPKGEAEIAKLLPTPTAAPTPPPTPTGAPLRATSTVTVSIANYEFTPASLTIPVGTRVVWINRDGEDHNVVSEETPRLLESPILKLGNTFTFEFTRPGTYKYTCEPHDQMHGVIIVN